MTWSRNLSTRCLGDLGTAWGQQCCVTGVKTLAAVRASHIKPWCESSDEERLDEMNGLPLVATLDALLDAGLITFTDEGELLVHDRLGKDECLRLGLHTLRLSRSINGRTKSYLASHRQMNGFET